MLIGVPKEVKDNEYRVGMTPAGVREARYHGHTVVVETKAGDGIGLSDDDYRAAGAEISESAEGIFDRASIIIKVKEPQTEECARLKEGQTLFTYLHLAPDPDQAKALLESGCTAIAYETVTDADGRLPLLAPMSEVAGRLSIQAGAHSLEKSHRGRGILLGGVPGVTPAKVTIIGGGIVGGNAARIAIGMGADVTILDRSVPRLRELDNLFGARLKTIYATTEATDTHVSEADLVIGAVLVPGAAAPKLVTRTMLGHMADGSVVVDVAIDQGGCFETSRPTTHADPTYVVEGVVHYCVANMPGGVARTSTFSLTNATLPYVLKLADEGWQKALADDPHFRDGLNIHAGRTIHPAVAEALNTEYTPAETLFSAS